MGLASHGVASAAACTPGAVYDPACDVDHDGDVDVIDIQLAAGHWNQNGVWTAGDYWSLLGNAATSPAVNFIGTTDNQPLVVRTNGVERMRVLGNGLVGIGTATPTDQLSVRNTGAGRAGFFQTDNGANNAAALAAVVQDGNGSALFANILDGGNSAPGLYATTQGTGPAARMEGNVQVWSGQLEVREDNHQVAIVDDNNGNKTWTLTSHQDTSGIGLWEDAATGRLVVAAGGNVGIGTLGPQAPLHVNQGANDGTDVLVTSPEFARMRMVAEAPNPDVTLSLQARGQSTATWAEIGTLSRHDLRFYTNDAYRMTLDESGNVGIGTTEPTTRLHVNGSNDGTDVMVTDGEFARMRMEASDPATDVLLSVQARRQRGHAAGRDRHAVRPRSGALHQRQRPHVPARQRRGLPGQRVPVGWHSPVQPKEARHEHQPTFLP